MRRILVALALFTAAPAHAEWWEARTEHFIVFSQSTAKDTSAHAERLERFDQALRSLQGVGSDEALSDSLRLTVYRFGDIDAIGTLARRPGVAGFYIPRASGSVAFVPAKKLTGEKTSLYKNVQIGEETVFFHEYAHHFMYRYFSAAYPSWYREGFAELNSTINLKDDGSFELGAPPQSRANAFQGGLNYSVKRMLLTTTAPNDEDVYAHYTFGWLLTHYLTFGGGRTGQLQTYLKLINAGSNAAVAARQAFGDLDKLESDVLRYKSKNRYPGAVVRPGNGAAPKIALRRLTPDEEAIMTVRLRSDRGVDKKSAKGVAADARAVSVRYPASLPVQLALIEAEYDADRLAEAERAANDALKNDPKSVKAMLYQGMVSLKRAKTDPAHYATARIWFGRANRADLGHPGPMLQFYETYRQANVAPPAIAVAGLERAFELAPYDGDLRILMVRQLLVERQGSLARQLLLPLALSPHESKRAKAWNEVAKLIEGSKIDEALAKLNARLAEEEKAAKDN